MGKRNVILIGICTLLVVVFGIILFFVLKEDEVKVGEVLTYKNYTILKGHTGRLEDYDKTLYAEGYKGNYDEAYYIEGTLKSNEVEKQNFVVIRFNLFDEKGNIVGEAIAGINGVENGKDYNFKAMSLTTTEDAKKVVKYDLKSIESK